LTHPEPIRVIADVKMFQEKQEAFKREENRRHAEMRNEDERRWRENHYSTKVTNRDAFDDDEQYSDFMASN
jgi:hypothetical protein